VQETVMNVLIELELPPNLEQFKLPPGVDERLQHLLDRQDRGEILTPSERQEAEGLVDLAELLSLLGLRAQRAWRDGQLDR
jgi:ribosome assembly protein YihI (activator of Der GTPase)